MKGRKLVGIIILALLTSSVFASANVIKNDDDSIGTVTMSGYHIRTLTPPWDNYNSYTIPMQGEDVEVTANSDSLNGYAQSKCEFDTFLQQYTEEGKAVFEHSFEWTSPVDSDSAYVQFDYYLSWEIKMYSSWGTQGDEARVRIGMLFYVDSDSEYRDIIDWTRTGGIDDEWSAQATYSPDGVIYLSLQKGKTYTMGVQVFAYSWATAFSGYILSRTTVSHQKEDSCVVIKWEDRPPARPSKVSGPTSVNLRGHLRDGVTCTYSVAYVTDPDAENVEYQWYFGDTGYYPSQTEWSSSTTVQHTWKVINKNGYEVKVKARGTDPLFEDGLRAESQYSEPLIVTTYFSFSKEISNNIVLKILGRFQGFLPLFERLQNL